MTDTIHNLNVVREALEAEGLTVHVKLIDQAIEDISAAPQTANLTDAIERMKEIEQLDSNGRYGRLAREAISALTRPERGGNDAKV